MANLKRLFHTYRAVKERPAELFDMSNWGVKEPCGTVCCAFGTEASTQYGKENGLKFVIDGYNHGLYHPCFKDDIGFEAAVAYYDIDLNEAYYLFDPGEYNRTSVVTKAKVLNRLNRFICRKYAESLSASKEVSRNTAKPTTRSRR